ncbi:MAG: ATP-grasp domain-containing protein [Kiloniellales bacterium]
MDIVNVLLMPGGGPGILAQLAALKSSTKYRSRAILADANPASGNLFLPEVDAAYRMPLCSDDGYLIALIRLIEREQIGVLYSGLDEELPVLARCRRSIEQHGCRLLLPPAEALDCALDKGAMFARLDGLVRMPRTWMLNDAFDADRVWAELAGRVVVKVLSSRGGRKIYMPEDGDEYDFVLSRVRKQSAATGERFLVQELIEGEEFNVSSLHAPDGALVYAVSRRKFETRRMKSTTTAAVIERNDMMTEQAVAAVEALGLVPGFNNVEAIVSRDDGLPYLIEVNGGRTAAQDMNLVAAGINLTDLLIDLSHGRAVEAVAHPRDGIAILKIRKDVVVEYADIAARVSVP